MVSLADLPNTIPIMEVAEFTLYPRSAVMFAIVRPTDIPLFERVSTTEQGVIGVIQPRDSKGTLYSVGCAAQIEGVDVQNDNVHSACLMGFSRFRLVRRISGFEPFSQAEVKWAEFAGDLEPESGCGMSDKAQFVELANRHFSAAGMAGFCSDFADSDDELLINFVAMHGKFSAADRQALLETRSLDERRAALVALMEISGVEGGSQRLQ